LKWLVVTDPHPLLPDSEANKTRLRQRFALLTFGFQTMPDKRFLLQRYSWNLAAANECNWYAYGIPCEDEQVTSFYIASTTIAGTLPPDLFWLSSMKIFTLYNTGIAGTLPTQLGWWTNVTSFSVRYNQLSGTVPSTVAAWTGLQTAYFDNNNLNGTMPVFAGGFCPEFGNGVDLWADCYNATGKAKISCECCETCY
jgi:hypothetical protein